MQKKIIALALAAVAGSAAAQTNVTVYGVADVMVASIKADGKNRMSAVESGGLAGSRIGFKGTEDLGNGLKALFTLEYALDMDNNAGVGAADAPWSSTATRQSLVGLTSSYGTVVAGRLQTAAFDFACAYNPVAGGVFDTTGRLAAATTISCGSAGRADNAVAYVSPSFGGLTVALNHARLTEEAAKGTAASTNVKDNTANILGVTYVNGPLQVGGVYTNVQRYASNTGATDNNINEYGLGATYDFGVVKAFASYQRNKVQNDIGADSKWQLGVSAPVGAKGVVLASYSSSSLKSTAATNDDTKAWSLAYRHNLSKRTALYAGYTRVANEAAASRGITNSATAASNFGTPTVGGDASVFALGMNHAF